MKVLSEPIPVRNAGIVLLNPFLPTLFERSGLIAGPGFSNIATQKEAVQSLQYAATGLEQTTDTELPLNKVLCGLSPEMPVGETITLTNDRKALVDHMIYAAIANWNGVDHQTVDGFRTVWLIRDGVLSEYEDKWEITVVRGTLDILLQRISYSFSVIHYGWMDKPLYVKWI